VTRDGMKLDAEEQRGLKQDLLEAMAANAR
jgi:hypothetical protein